MEEDVFKAPKSKRPMSRGDYTNWSTSPRKRRRTKEDFVAFCNFVLAYTQYDTYKQEELRANYNASPLDSGGSTAESWTSESTTGSFSSHEEDSKHHESGLSDGEMEPVSGRNDEYGLITCFCMKPYAGRPMIECSHCWTWIHLSCAKIRKNNIPEDFVCQQCKDEKMTKRKSKRARSEKKLISA